MSKKIGVLGCGWLGLPLAEHLLTSGHRVSGSTTSNSKISVLSSKKITPYLIKVTKDGIGGDLSFFDEPDIIIIAIPPGLRSNPKKRFDLMIEHCKQACIKNNIKEVIFISSTSVYGNQSGVLTEESQLLPESTSGKQLVSCENLLVKTPEFSTTILRMGGLIGVDRHPVFQLGKKQFIENPNGSVNLIHLTDCIHIINSLIKRKIVNNVYNCVTPYHPSRQKYYNQMADQLGCKRPVFKGINSIDRQVSSDKLTRDFAYHFKVQNLLILS